jgi:hypothetical protein
MKIFCYTYGHNEIQLLPLKLKWCIYHGLTMRYFDNESTDGSREWAIENGVFVEDIITKGAFDLRMILPTLNEDLQFERPEWFCMLGVDLFIAPPNGEKISKYLHNKKIHFVECQYANICFTGSETQNGDLRHFDRCALKGDFSMGFATYTLLVRYVSGNYMAADKIHYPDWFIGKTISVENEDSENWWLINFGHTKTAEEREETYQRRKLAWQRGLNKYAGAHYNTGKAVNWVVPIEKTLKIEEKAPIFRAHQALLKILYHG